MLSFITTWRNVLLTSKIEYREDNDQVLHCTDVRE